MNKPAAARTRRTKPDKALRDFGRAFGGALIFSLPMLMTSEFWQLGFTIDPLKLLVFVTLAFPVLTRLSILIGFEETRSWTEDAVDAAFALLAGALVALILLACFGALTPDMSAREISGKIAIQSVPAAIGALLARSQLGSTDDDSIDAIDDKQETYGGEMFVMAVGALFLGLNVAPTEEVLLIAYRVSPWHILAISALSLGIVHAFVFVVGFKGGSKVEPDRPWWNAFLRFTLPGYMLALAVSFYLLWTFHDAGEVPIRLMVFSTIVLGLPASVGAAAARLIL